MLWKFTNINNLLHKDASQLVGQILREALTPPKKPEGHTTKLVSGFRGGSKLRMSLDVIGFCIINIYGISSLPESNKDELLVLQWKTARTGKNHTRTPGQSRDQNWSPFASFSIEVDGAVACPSLG